MLTEVCTSILRISVTQTFEDADVAVGLASGVASLISNPVLEGAVTGSNPLGPGAHTASVHDSFRASFRWTR